MALILKKGFDDPLALPVDVEQISVSGLDAIRVITVLTQHLIPSIRDFGALFQRDPLATILLVGGNWWLHVAHVLSPLADTQYRVIAY